MTTSNTSSSPLSTPVALRADSKRNQVRLVAAARELVAEQGVNVTAADIAARAQVGVGTLYRRFGSKEALILDILADGVDEVQSVAEAALRDPAPWLGFSTFFTFFSQTQVNNQGIAEYVASSASLSNEKLHSTNGHLQSLVQEIVLRAHQSGELRAEVTWQDVVVLSRASVSAGECLGVRASPEQWRRSCAIILQGMKKPTFE